MADNYSVVVTVGGQAGRRSNSGIKPSKAATGEYDVQFPEPINRWLWLATLAPTDDTPQAAGAITAELTQMTDDTLHVRTFNLAAAAAAADRPFHLHVRKMNS